MTKKQKSSTCILAVKERNGKILIAADKRVSWDFNQAQDVPSEFPKVMKRNGLLIASTGDSGLCHLIVHDMTIRPIPTKMSSSKYMRYHFLPQIRSTLFEAGLADDKLLPRLPHDYDAEIIVACKGTLWSIVVHNTSHENVGGMVDLTPVSVPYASGCGGVWAWASMISSQMGPNLYMKDSKTGKYRQLSIRQQVDKAMRIAGEMSPGCSTSYDIVEED